MCGPWQSAVARLEAQAEVHAERAEADMKQARTDHHVGMTRLRAELEGKLQRQLEEEARHAGELRSRMAERVARADQQQRYQQLPL